MEIWLPTLADNIKELKIWVSTVTTASLHTCIIKEVYPVPTYVIWKGKLPLLSFAYHGQDRKKLF